MVTKTIPLPSTYEISFPNGKRSMIFGKHIFMERLPDKFCSSPSEMLYGEMVQLPGEFFKTCDQLDPTSHLATIREIVINLKSTEISHHQNNSTKFFNYQDLKQYSHVWINIFIDMPKLRKQSSEQRRQKVREAGINYHVRNIETHRLQNSQRIAVLRQNEEYRESERIRDRIARSLRREHSEYRDAERLRDSQARSSHRFRRFCIPEYGTTAHYSRRQDPLYRSKEQVRNTIEHSLRREDANYRSSERQRDAAAHSSRREDPLYRNMEQVRNTIEHSLRREDEQYRDIERQRDAAAHSSRRENPLYRSMEQLRNTLEHSLRREDDNFRNIERQRDAVAHFVRRQDPLYHAMEQERNTLEHSLRREDANFRSDERERDSIAHISRRSNSILRAAEQRRNTNSRRASRMLLKVNRELSNQMRNVRVRLHRINPINRTVQNERQALRNRENRQNLSPESRSEMLAVDAIRHSRRMLEEFNNSVKKNQWRTMVFKSVKGGKVPTICLSNGLHFPEIPHQLKGLTALEERFVAPRIPFMRIVSLGYNRQCAVRGAVVNVPIQVDNVVSVLPRTFNQTEVIQVHLKRRLEYNHSFMTETIRPAKIFNAIRYLINTELYQKHKISIAEDWLNNVGLSEEVPFLANAEDQELVQDLAAINSNIDVIQELNPQETLLDNIPMENIPLSRISIAPGEGKRPLDLLMDEDAEELSFPTIYCGIKRLCEASVAKVIRSEIRRYDRRCARVDKVLYSYKKLELYNLIIAGRRS
ncbi:hypothetical protein CVS40_9996 [Lucilia cuprina]|nr:hypothetical protein CVS40_9996 [Lucilia cuprina]